MAFPTDFVHEFFCQPILDYSGYNLINTAVYGAIMFFLAFWVIYPFFTRKGVEFNYEFGLRVLLFVIAGSSFRILEDLRILPRSCNPLDPAFYTVTPGVYILFGVLTIAALGFSLWLGKKTGKKYLHYFGVIGAVLALPFLVHSFLFFKNMPSFAVIILAWLAVMAVIFFAAKKFKPKFVKEKIDFLVIGGQAFDGVATFVATQLLNCGEQHPVSEAVLGIFAPAFVVVKIVIALAILYFVEKEVANPNMRGFIKVFILILGFAPGIRDALTVGVGTCG